MEYGKLLDCLLTLGEQMLICGAEISRVEDTIGRISDTYNVEKTDVFVITSVMFLTLTDGESNTFSGTRRVSKYNTNLDKLHKYNDLSRQLCAKPASVEEFEQRIEEIKSEKPYPLPVQCLVCAMISASFTLFFGGGFRDAAVSAVIGIILKLVIFAQSKTKVNMVFSNVISSAVLSALALLAVKSGIGQEASKIIIGNIMILIPGVGLTNSIRDIISGDIISGMLRLFEAVIVSLAIAAGYILMAVVFGGVGI